MTSACFANGTFAESLAGKCLSNLLAAQYRRFILDIYWDPERRQFGFCPVAVPVATPSSSLIPTTAPSSATALAANASVKISSSPPSPASLLARRHLAASELFRDFEARQATSVTSLAQGNPITNANGTSTTSTQPTPPTTTTSITGETLFHLGRYQCSQHFNLSTPMNVMLDYIHNTSNIVQANLLLIELNIHAGAASDAPENPAQALSGDKLPKGGELAGAQFSSAMSSYIYAPGDLMLQRSNLNHSWFSAVASKQPIAEYFTMEVLQNGDYATPDGWPSEDYIQATTANRVLLTWGTTDVQMQGYNFTGDDNVIFPEGALSGHRLIGTNSNGLVTSGCLYDQSKTDLPLINSSWAVSSYDLVGGSFSVTSNLTSCGISPVLNNTLSNANAITNPGSYLSWSEASVWNWAPGQPQNTSSPGVDDDYAKSQYRCALMDTTPAYNGRWRVDDCGRRYRAACRVNNQPYVWQLSSDTVSFGAARYACPKDTVFTAPRTGLENTYLYHKILSSSGNIDGIWVNFNSLDVDACWVTTGPNGTCPYFLDPAAVQQRNIVIPTVGGIIVLILVALTLFAKCNVNRRNSKYLRRGEGGWDYEGVPS